jgi:Anthrone oxygenase
MLAGQLAVTIAAMFTGAAIYINITEQPARLQLDNRSLLAEWKPAYKRGYAMQASLAIIGGLFGLLAYLSALDWRWLLGAIVLLANWPYTLFVIAPINRRLMDTSPEAATAETRRMLERWGTSMPAEARSPRGNPDLSVGSMVTPIASAHSWRALSRTIGFSSVGSVAAMPDHPRLHRSIHVYWTYVGHETRMIRLYH